MIFIPKGKIKGAKRMILSTGKILDETMSEEKSAGGRRRPFSLCGKDGFSFLECMAAVSILSLGIVMIYKALLLSLDAQQYARHRLYASQYMQSQTDFLQAVLAQQGVIPAEILAKARNVILDHRPIIFSDNTTVTPFENWLYLLQLRREISWQERGKNFALSQTIYLSPKEARNKL